MSDKIEVFNEKYNICFLDAEFNQSIHRDNYPPEIVSIGLVICDSDFNYLDKYYSVVLPMHNKVLSKEIKNLTKLSQKEIYAAPPFCDVISEVIDLIDQYDVYHIYTWGPEDKIRFKNDLDINKKILGKKQYSIFNAYIDNMHDISKYVSNIFDVSKCTVGLSTLKYICEMNGVVSHNALDDAEDLYKCMKFIYANLYPFKKKNDIYNSSRKLLKAYYEDRSKYNNHRRFRVKDSDLFGKSNIDINITHTEDFRIKALLDDIKLLNGDATLEELEFPSIEEYFEGYYSK